MAKFVTVRAHVTVSGLCDLSPFRFKRTEELYDKDMVVEGPALTGSIEALDEW